MFPLTRWSAGPVSGVAVLVLSFGSASNPVKPGSDSEVGGTAWAGRLRKAAEAYTNETTMTMRPALLTDPTAED